MAYAYRDKYGILHVVEEQKTANEFAGEGNPVVKCSCPHGAGFPTTKEGEVILDYGEGRVFVGGNMNDGQPLEALTEEAQEEVKAILKAIGL